MDITLTTPDTIEIVSEKRIISLSPDAVVVDGLSLDMPGEYEKSEILASVSTFDGIRVVRLFVESRTIVYIPGETLELSKEVLDFLGAIDILILPGTKSAAKLSESLETRMIIPFGEGRSVFLQTLGQTVESVRRYRTKDADFDGAVVRYVALDLDAESAS